MGWGTLHVQNYKFKNYIMGQRLKYEERNYFINLTKFKVSGFKMMFWWLISSVSFRILLPAISKYVISSFATFL